MFCGNMAAADAAACTVSSLFTDASSHIDYACLQQQPVYLYSMIRVITLYNNGIMSISPNPAREQTVLYLAGSVAGVELLLDDITGRVLLTLFHFYQTNVPTALASSVAVTHLSLKRMLNDWAALLSFNTMSTFLPSGVL